MQSLVARHQTDRCGCSSIDDPSGNGPSSGCEGEGAVTCSLINRLLRSSINGRKWQGSRIHLGTKDGVEIPDSASSAQQELYVPVFLAPPPFPSCAFHLPPLSQSTTISPTKLPLPSKNHQSLFLTQRRYSTGPTFLRHMKLLHAFSPTY